MIQDSKAKLDEAGAMEVTQLELGTEMTQEMCTYLAGKIKANYKVDPFQFTYEGGTSTHSMCGGQWGGQKNFHLNSVGVTHHAIQYTQVIQLQGMGGYGWRNEISNYFLDASYRIVEIQWISSNPKTQEILSYGVDSVDEQGNVYISLFHKNYVTSKGVEKDIKGVQTIERYIAADGSNAYPITRSRIIYPAKDQMKNFEQLIFNRTDQRDWQDFQLPITFAGFGGFYGYDGKYYSGFMKPTFMSSLTVKFRGGKEVCAFGDIKAAQKSTSFPLNQKDYYDCVNY